MTPATGCDDSTTTGLLLRHRGDAARATGRRRRDALLDDAEPRFLLGSAGSFCERWEAVRVHRVLEAVRTHHLTAP